MTNLKHLYPTHPSAEQVAQRAKDLLESGTLVQSLAYISCARLDIENYLDKIEQPLLFRNRLRTGTRFEDQHDLWILNKFSQIPEEIELFSYYSCDIGVPLRICGLYNTRLEVKWLNSAMKITQEPSTWLQDVLVDGFLPKKLYYGDGFRYEI